MIREIKKLTAKVLVGVIAVSAASGISGSSVITVYADSTAGEKPYISLGADLKSSERKTVLKLLGVEEDDLDQYTVVEITNQDEHTYLDDYLSSKVIGTRALSSALVEKAEEGDGIDVTTENITYCTERMYENALTTAGISDAKVKVAGPFEITGTAALVGAMKAYEEMTGDSIDAESKDAATNELVVTSELADAIGDSDKAEQFIALVKEEVLSDDVKTEEDIEKVIDESAEKIGIDLTEEQKNQIAELMEKISSLDLSVEDLKKQAQDIYDQLSHLNLDELDSNGIFGQIKEILQNIYEALTGLF